MPKITPGEEELAEIMRADHSIAARHMVGLGCRSDWTPEATRRRALEQLRTAEQRAWPWWAFA